MDLIAQESSASEGNDDVTTSNNTPDVPPEDKVRVVANGVSTAVATTAIVGSDSGAMNVSQETTISVTATTTDIATAIGAATAIVAAHEATTPQDSHVSTHQLPNDEGTMNGNGDRQMDHDRSNDATAEEPQKDSVAAVDDTVAGSVNVKIISDGNGNGDDDDTTTRNDPLLKTAAEKSTTNASDGNLQKNVSNSNSNSLMAFTSETATLSQKISHIGSSYSHTTATTAGTGGVIQTIYGRPVHVKDSNGSFPELASVLGPYFCLGQLGKGTFSTIHKCIDMQYYHNSNINNQIHPSMTSSGISSSTLSLQEQQQRRRDQVVAAKVELGSFQQSGVLESEATMLDYLHRHVQPLGTVPNYTGHFRSDKFAALFMEFLPGEDMYQIRERVMAINNANLTPVSAVDPTVLATRRISIDDAVYLTADVMLPLLRSIHEVGVVHRDVKPSNCVRKNEHDGCKDFCMVDFGLSKSIIVAEDSDIADTDHPWIEGYPWMKPLNYAGTKAYYRKERTKADFRGTSMYASLRVHQGKDYCARDDLWSLLYVFCDLISGGLPWMSMAANRDRSACQKMKEWIHGEGASDNSDGSSKEHHIDELLKGDLYHIAKYRRDRQKEAKVDTEQLSAVPEPLNLSLEPDKIYMLKVAFEDLATLQFWDMPDYEKIQSAIRYFKENQPTASEPADPKIQLIDWSAKRITKPVDQRTKHWWSSSSNIPEWKLPEDDNNRVDDGIFDDVDVPNRNGREEFHKRLPMELQFHISQMNYNLIAERDGSVPLHRVLHDWMRVVLPLLHHEWNSRAYEDGGHRTTTDGFKRTCYLELLHQCVQYASAFDNFQCRECFYETETVSSVDHSDAPDPNGEARAMKRRKVVVQCGTSNLPNSDLLFVSKTLFGLEHAIRIETSKKTPPPVRISFG